MSVGFSVMAGENNEQLRATAGEYVLGTLDDIDLERFEAALSDNPQARDEVAYWEQRLGVLALALQPVDPPARVWQRIASRIETRQSPGRHRSGNVGLWRGLAMAASVAALIMAAVLFSGSPPPSAPTANPEPAFASMVYDKDTGTSWLVTADPGSHTLDVVAMGGYDVPEGKILRAWLIPEGSAPIGLGEMPLQPGHRMMRVPEKAVRVMDQRRGKSMQLAVSLEDIDDAHADAPHGKVLWAVPMARRTG